MVDGLIADLLAYMIHVVFLFLRNNTGNHTRILQEVGFLIADLLAYMIHVVGVFLFLRNNTGSHTRILQGVFHQNENYSKARRDGGDPRRAKLLDIYSYSVSYLHVLGDVQYDGHMLPVPCCLYCGLRGSGSQRVEVELDLHDLYS